MEVTDIFRGTVVDVSKRSATIDITGTLDKIQALARVIPPFALIEAVRTGRADGPARVRDVGLGRLCDVRGPGGRAAGGPLCVRWFAFAPEGGWAPEGQSLPPGPLTHPEVSLPRRGESAWLTASVLVQ